MHETLAQQKTSSLRPGRSKIFGLLITVALASASLLGLSVTAHASTPTVDAKGEKLEFNNTEKIGENATDGFSVRYTNVISDGTTTVDAILSVTKVQNVTLSNVDRVSTVNNWQLWSNLRIGSGGGFVTYTVDFVKSGTREPVLLNDFSVNVGDVDARQYVEFTGPTSYTLAKDTQLAVQTSENTSGAGIPEGAFRFAETNAIGASDDDTRFWAQVNYASVSSVDVKIGAIVGGSALYQVSFGAASWGTTADSPVFPTPPSYEVQYDCNPGALECTSGATLPTSEPGGTAHTVRANGFVFTGYEFVSWNTRRDGSGVTYLTGSQIKPTTDVTLYAIWESTSTLVRYFGNGSTGGIAPAQVTVPKGGQYVTESSGNLVRDGFQFVGWNTNSAGTGAFYLPGTLMNVVANTDFFAVWQPIPVVPPDSPINIDLEPGQPIGGAEVDYVIPNQTPVPNCDPTNDPSSAWSLTVNPVDPPGAAYEIDAGCTPPDGDVFGTAVLPQDVPGGIYEVVYESTSGEKIIRYFVVGPDGTFVGQSNVDPRIAKTGANSGVLPLIGVVILLLGIGAGFSRRIFLRVR